MRGRRLSLVIASASYLIEMLTGESGTRMPPESEGSALSAEQIELFKLDR